MLGLTPFNPACSRLIILKTVELWGVIDSLKSLRLFGHDFHITNRDERMVATKHERPGAVFTDKTVEPKPNRDFHI